MKFKFWGTSIPSYGTYGGLWQQGQSATVTFTAPPKPTPIWQKHKREPKWHLYLGGWTLCDAGRPTNIEYYSQQWVLTTGTAMGTPLIPNAIPYQYNPHSPISPTEYLQWPHPDQSPAEEDRCEDCFAEYAALKLSDEVA